MKEITEEIERLKAIFEYPGAPKDTLVCRGSIALGSACMKCHRCLFQLERYPKALKQLPKVLAALEIALKDLSLINSIEPTDCQSEMKDVVKGCKATASLSLNNILKTLKESK